MELLIKYLFWISIFIIFYAYFGYGVLITLIIKIPHLRYIFKVPEGLGSVTINPKVGRYTTRDDKNTLQEKYVPAVTLLIAAYNEENVIDEKIENCRALDYPSDKLEILFVTDGSTDGTNDKLAQYPDVQVYYKPERRGKIAAVNRVVPLAKGEIIVFSDANSIFNPEAIRKIVRHFRYDKVGCVAGEKRVQSKSGSSAGEGEGLYWRYESYLKKKDSELCSVVGAAGEIFALRKELFEPAREDSILEDFIISLTIASRGYRVIYEPEAVSLEEASESVRDEFKRRARISAGGFQAIARLKHLLNIKKYGLLSFQYISHRVLRWTVVPPALISAFGANYYLALTTREAVYEFFFYAQYLVYVFAAAGWILEKMQIKFKLTNIPFTFLMMNYSVFVGFYRFIFGKQKVTWEKAVR